MGKHLELLTIEKPCTASWEAMTGDDRVRHCTQCHLDVYDLSAMNEADAEKLVAEREGHMCFRFTRRADGTLITQDCEPLRAEARPCTPRPHAPSSAPHAPSPPRAMGLEPPTPPNPGAGPVGPPPRPVPMMGAPPRPPPRVSVEEVALARDAVLAELSRAVRAHADADRAEALVRAIEKEITAPPGDGGAAGCPTCKGALWVPGAAAKKPHVPPPVRTQPEIAASKALLDEVTPAVKASFDDRRAASLLREMTRLVAFYNGRFDSCPHCHDYIVEPPPPPIAEPPRPTK